MRQAYRILPVYAGDVSGACSALYELGGMTVMHDPSGCNSTYNTHDEVRWYDRDSLIFLSGLRERDAILGNDEKLVQDVAAAAEELHPAFIALCASPIPFLNGTDMAAIAALVERRTGIPSFAVPTNGLHDYVSGAEAALEQLARRVREPARRVRRSVNLLGLTPLDFAVPGESAALRDRLACFGWRVRSVWAMDDALANLMAAGEAEVNLVVSSVGLAAARVLRQRFGTPYAAALPVPGLEEAVARALETAARTGENAYPCLSRGAGEPETVFVGEPVTMGSAAAALCAAEGCGARVLCPVEARRELLAPGDVRTRGEEEAQRALRGAKRVAADPFYREILPEGAAFLPLPHLAFSGRSHLRQARSFLSLWKEPCKWE